MSGPHETVFPRCMLTDFPFEAADHARLTQAIGADAIHFYDRRAELREGLAAHPETDCICLMLPPADLLTLAPHLRWLALASAGADTALRDGLVRPSGNPIVTTANGVHTYSISEFVLSAMLLWARHWPALFEIQREGTFPPVARRQGLSGTELYGQTVGIIGLGAIGRQVARVTRALGMRVVAMRRASTPDGSDPDVDVLLAPNQLETLLAESDFVVLSAPSTPETYHLIDATTLRQMKPSAVLVNIARGDLVNEADLLAALQSGVIAGAALDVFEVEPLPDSSPLWAAPNVILSPHIAGMSTSYSRRLTDLLLDNLARFRAGEPLRNVVDVARGY